MLPDDGPSGPKHVGAIQRDILSVSCSILCFNKECSCWQKSFELKEAVCAIHKYNKHETYITRRVVPLMCRISHYFVSFNFKQEYP
jgi:hypothetical protein